MHLISQKFALSVLLICAATPLRLLAADNINADDAARIDALLSLDLEGLGEVEVKLDDVFDVFDGLLKRQTVEVASGVAQDASTAPAVTTVITAQDLEATGARTLTEALEAVPGLNVSRNFFMYAPIYTIRGIYSSFNPQVLIMINGVPLKDLHAGNPSSRGLHIPVYYVQRVEIMRGPGSAVHGADALSGIINVITKTAKDIAGTEVGARVGSFGQADGWVLHGGNYQGFELATMVRYGSEDSHEEVVTKDFQSIMDQRFGSKASHAPAAPAVQRDSLNLRVDISRTTADGATWRAQLANQSEFDAGAGVGPAQALDAVGRTDLRITDLILSWEQPKLAQHWSMNVDAAFTDRGYESIIQVYPPGAFGGQYPIGFNTIVGLYERSGRLNLSNIYSGLADHVMRFGAGYTYADQYQATQSSNWLYPPQNPPRPYGGELVDISDTRFMFNREEVRSSYYAFAQDAWQFTKNWELTGGARYDDYSDFGQTFNLRGALVWQARTNLTAKLLYGEAFRAPSFQELYNANNPLSQGNPNLTAETIDTLELAFDFRPRETIHTALNLYYFTWQDGIEFLSPPGQTSTNTQAGQGARIAQNMADDIKGHGFEFELRWKTSVRSSLMFNYAWHKVEQAGVDWGYYPQQDAYARFDWLVYPDWYLDAQANWVAQRQRQLGDARTAIDDYLTVDLAVRYKKAKATTWNLAFGVKNLFDEAIFEPSPGPDLSNVQRLPYDLPMAGRSWFAELRYKF